MPVRVELPTSGVILGEVLRALRLLPEVKRVVPERTARRVLRGEARVKPEERRAVVAAAVAAVLPAELIEDLQQAVPTVTDEPAATTHAAWTGAVESWMSQWDAAAAYLRGSGPAVRTKAMPLLPWLRLLTWELAIRSAGYREGLGLPPRSEVDARALIEGRAFAGLLANAMADAGGISRAALSSEARVSETTVDAWLNGSSLPRPESLLDIVAVLVSRGCGASEPRLMFHMRVAVAASELVKSLRESKPPDGALAAVPPREESFGYLFTTAERHCQGLMDEMPPPEDDRRGACWRFAPLGTASPMTRFLLVPLAQMVRDSYLLGDLQALATGCWTDRVVALYREVSDPVDPVEEEMSIARVAQITGMPQDISRAIASSFRDGTWDGPMLWGKLCPNPGGWLVPMFPTVPEQPDVVTFTARPDPTSLPALEKAESNARFLDHDPAEAVAVLRRRVKEFPDDAMAHFHLGAALAAAGKVDEAIMECRVAKLLQPDWLNPAVEIGIIYGNAGRLDEALDAMAEAAEEHEHTVHLSYSYGVILVWKERLGEAEPWFRKVIAINADHAPALGYLAHCLLQRKERIEGRRLAKRAAELGEPWVLNRLQAEHYPRR